MYVVIHLNCYTDAVAFSDTEAAYEGDILFEMVFFNGFLEQVNYFGRSFYMAGAADAYLNDHCRILYTFAMTFFSKNSFTLSGETEWKSSSTVTHTPF